MRGLPHVAENYKSEIFEARFFFLQLLRLYLCRSQNSDSKHSPASCVLKEVRQPGAHVPNCSVNVPL